jgi:hypothetical protein
MRNHSWANNADTQGCWAKCIVKVKNPGTGNNLLGVSDELHLEGIAEPFCKQYDSCYGPWEQIHDAPNPGHQRQQSILF